MIRRPGEEAWKPVPCPYGKPGDLLWVRETWAQPTSLDPGPVFYRADYPRCVPAKYENVPQDPDVIRWSPGIHMFRWMSRLTLRIAEVRVERLQEISAEDCIAEGLRTTFREHDAVVDLRRQYRELWESINGLDSWAENPFVWVLGFDCVHKNVEEVLRNV